MKQRITCFLLLILSVTDVNSQVCPPKNLPVEEVEQTTDSNPEMLYEPERFDPENLPVPSRKQGVFRLGYGVNTILSVNQSEFVSSKRNPGWFDDHVAHVFDLSGQFGSKRKWVAGFSFSFQKLGTISESRRYLPEDDIPASILQETTDLTATFDLKARIYSPLIYTEYSFLDFWNHFSGIARFETGVSIYRAQMSVSYQDTCGCTKMPVSDWEMAASFNVGVGIGLKWEYRFMGVKTMLTYQSQTKVTFKTQEDYAGYSFAFDAAGYDFKGAPADSRFALLKSGDPGPRRYSPLYLQLMVYFRIGSR